MRARLFGFLSFLIGMIFLGLGILGINADVYVIFGTFFALLGLAILLIKLFKKYMNEML